MAESYWDRFTTHRLTRRRALAGAGGFAIGAAALSLMGCGGSSKDEGKVVDKSGLIYTPKDSTSQAKAGGTLKHFTATDIVHFDAVADPGATVVALSSEPFYPRLLKMKSVKYPEEADGSSIGEAAESWEVSPDKLQITFKLRQGMKWDSRAPTSGRIIDAEDIVFSWNKFKRLNTLGPSLAYDATNAPEAPVETLTAPDSKTIVVKLHQPYASVIPLFSARDVLYIGPRESDGGFDPKTTVRGHGPYILEEYVPSARFVWKRNPDYYVKDRPFLERVELPIVSEQAQQLAQFRAGGIYTDVVTGSQENVLVTKREVPDSLLLQDANYPVSSGNMITFGWEQGSPWKDVRMRQALSMMLDREAFIDVIDNRENFRKGGLELPVLLNSVVPAGWGDVYLDPSDQKEFGPNAKYLRLDLAEAKKLVGAAGFPNVEFDINYGTYAPPYNRIVEMYAGFFTEGGLRPRQQIITPQSVWLDQYSRAYRSKSYASGLTKGFSGIAIVPERTYPTVAVQIYNQFHKDGGGYRGMVPAGGSVVDGDAKSNDLALKIIQEFDHNKQKSLVHEFIRYETEQSFYVPRISSAKAFSLWWPAIGNLGAYVSYPGASMWSDLRLNWWLDESKAPIKKA